MDDLVTWLRAQLDDDEQVATSATPGAWHWVDPGGKVKSALVAGDWQPGWRGWEMVLPAAGGDMYPSKGDADHIARHNPARVLREVEAKRLIIAQYETARDQARDPVSAKNYEMTRLEQGALGDVLRLLALPYADRPGYRDEWRPE